MLSKLELLDTYYVYLFEFLSSFEFLIAVFLVYLTSKLVFCGCKIRASSIILGIAFILSSFCAIGTIRGLWYNSNAIYSQGIQTWKYMSGWFVNSGIARVGVAAANDMLMLLATLAAVIVPLILLLVLYILHLKNAKQAAWN